jgi:hypothetical protein
LAQVRLAQGETTSAASGLRQALAEAEPDRLARARLLPTQVEVALAAQDFATAGAAAVELEEISIAFQCEFLRAAADAAQGTLQLALGDAPAAARFLRRSLSGWRAVEAPYEAAQVQLVLARALIAAGERVSAELEQSAAHTVLAQLAGTPTANDAGL